ncbi:hypothetical protein [Pseudomonas profundi]|uniref:hypothetical protein n=1 Tax=Pseudomonas profundi TaxID=1981513 RepID=UPI001238BB87|nr:hypothetical protein [Pseudomonas profundi]
MTDHIDINEERLQQVLAEMRERNEASALTTDIIELYMGGFHSNKGVPVKDSWNAQFGKYLKANSSKFGINELSSHESVKVNGHPTSSSRWSLSG